MIRNRFFWGIAVLLFVLSSLLLVSCSMQPGDIGEIINPNNPEEPSDPDDPSSSDTPIIPSSDTYFIIESTKEKITFKVSGLGVVGEIAGIYAVDSSAYYYLDSNRGLSKEIDNGSTKIADYACGSDFSFEIPRYSESGRDFLYKKYYIATSDNILIGPVWVTKFEPTYNSESIFNSWGNITKKGIMIEDGGSIDYAIDLGVSQAKVDIKLNNLICFNEGFTSFDGYLGEADSEMVYAEDVVACAYASDPDLVPYVFDGTTYYFRLSQFKGYDDLIKQLSDEKIMVTVDILLTSTTNQKEVPYYMEYPHVRNSNNIKKNLYDDNGHGTVMVNTSNHYGAGYYGALISFIANRYSTGEYGYVKNFILLNEVDDPRNWNGIVADSEPLPSFAEYMEEYYRALRIGSLAISDVDTSMTMLICMENHWSTVNRVDTFAPKKMVDKLISLSNSQGNFNWGIASHAYSNDLSAYDVMSAETKAIAYISGDAETTRFITVGNLELYEAYLNQSDRLQPDGSVRPVYLTEVGVTGKGEEQAASAIYSYYKAEMIDCIKGYLYFTLSDRSFNKVSFGLLDQNMNKKLVYSIWKDIDEEDTDKYISYIESCGYYDRKTNKLKAFSEGSDYLDVIKLVSDSIGTVYDWDTKWAQMISRLGLEK